MACTVQSLLFRTRCWTGLLIVGTLWLAEPRLTAQTTPPLRHPAWPVESAVDHGIRVRTLRAVADKILQSTNAAYCTSVLFPRIYRSNKDEAAEVLLKILVEHSDQGIAETAAWLIDNRIIKSPVTDPMLDRVAKRIELASSPRIAARIAYAVARGEQVNSGALAVPAARRFVDQIRLGDAVMPVGRGKAYMSDEVLHLNEFIRAFRFMDRKATQEALIARIRLARDPRERKWLFIGLGAAGDPEVGDYLAAVIDTDSEDLSTRSVALRAYAIALGERAAPLLEKYVHDTTPLVIHPKWPRPDYPLAIVAKDELSRLQRGR